jgi:hypothetical protein
MKRSLRIACLLVLAPTAEVFAAAGAEGSSLAAKIFLIFLGLIIAFQLIPAFMLLVTMLKGLFSRAPQARAMDQSKESGQVR